MTSGRPRSSQAPFAPPPQGQSLLGLHEDVNDALPLGGHCCPVLGQGHHGTGIQQPVAIRMAHCGGREGSTGRQESPILRQSLNLWVSVPYLSGPHHWWPSH